MVTRITPVPIKRSLKYFECEKVCVCGGEVQVQKSVSAPKCPVLWKLFLILSFLEF